MSEDKPKKELTQKEEKFVEVWMLTGNKSRAYREAYDCEKSKESTVNENACRLSKDSKIASRFNELQQDVANLCGITKATQVNEFRAVGYSDLTNVLQVGSKNGLYIISSKDFDSLTDDQKKAIKKVKTKSRMVAIGDGEFESIQEFEIELHDKLKALDSINKMLGFNEAEKIEHSGNTAPVGPPILNFITPRVVDPEVYLAELEEKKKDEEKDDEEV